MKSSAVCCGDDVYFPQHSLCVLVCTHIQIVFIWQTHVLGILSLNGDFDAGLLCAGLWWYLYSKYYRFEVFCFTNKPFGKVKKAAIHTNSDV